VTVFAWEWVVINSGVYEGSSAMKRMCALIAILWTSMILAQDAKPQPASAGPGHKFLKQFVGDWECETDFVTEPGKPAQSSTGTMTGRMIGELWAVVNVHGDAFGQPYHGQGTFGFDSSKKRYHGTWTDSMSEFMWRYDGTTEGYKLILNPKDPIRRNRAR
jgi:hypothetical protein